MRKRVLALLICLSFLGGVAVLWHVYPFEPEPAFQGKRLTSWLRMLDYDSHRVPESAVQAVRGIGTNALPTLFRKLRYKDPQFVKTLNDLAWKLSFHRIYLGREMADFDDALSGFEALGELASPAIPRLESMFADPRLAGRAALALSGIGTNAVPALTQALISTNSRIRSAAAMGLGEMVRKGKLSGGSESIVNDVAELLHDRDPSVRVSAAHALGDMGVASIAVPALVIGLSDSYDLVRWLSARGLGGYRAEAVAAIPALQKATDDPSAEVRSNAVFAIDQILQNEMTTPKR